MEKMISKKKKKKIVTLAYAEVSGSGAHYPCIYWA